MSKRPERRHYELRIVLLLGSIVLISGGTIRFIIDPQLQLEAAEVIASPREDQPPVLAETQAVRRQNSESARDTVPPAIGAAAERNASTAPAHLTYAARPRTTAPVAHVGTSPSGPEPSLRAAAEELVASEQWESATLAFAELHRADPENGEIALRYARLLAWSDQYATAAHVMAREVYALPTAELRMEQARYLWWGGDAAAADEALTGLLRTAPAHREARELREMIRRGGSPTVELAARWVAETGGATEHLALARVLTRENRSSDALPHFRVVLERNAAGDSVYIELADAAAVADSAAAVAYALEQYLRHQPTDRAAQLRLARQYGAMNRTQAAIAVYDDLVQEQGPLREDAMLRFERAQLLAWAGRGAEVERELTQLAVHAELRGRALKLLGDVVRWRQDWRAAEGYYAAAEVADPLTAGLADARSELQKGRRAALQAMSPSTPRWKTVVQSLSDSEGFSWLGVRTSGAWLAPGGVITSLSLRRGQLGGADAPLSDPSYTQQHSAALGARLPFTHGSVRVEAGVDEMGAKRSGTWGAGLALFSLQGQSLALDFDRTSAGEATGTLAGWEAGMTADRARLALSHPIGLWVARSSSRWERFDSSLGDGHRAGSSLYLERSLMGSWTTAVGAEVLAATSGSPTSAAGTPLYWAPELFFAPTASLIHSTRLPGIEARFSVSPGLAYVREREAGLNWYDDPWTPFVGLGFELAVEQRSWKVGVSGDWSGAPGDAYRSGGAQFEVSYTPERP